MEPDRTDPEIVITEPEAKQARTGRPVLYVLIGGLILAAVAFVVLNGLANTDVFEPEQSDPDRNPAPQAN